MERSFCLFLRLFHFLLQVAHLCSLFIILIRCRDHWIVFFSKKVAAQNLSRGHGRWRKITEKKYRFKHYARLPQGVRRRKKELSAVNWKKAFTWLQFHESKQKTFCSAYDEFPTVGQRNWKENVLKWALNHLYFFLQIIMQFEPIHPYNSFEP